MEERANAKAKEWASLMKAKHEETNGDKIVFDEKTLAYLIKKCLMYRV